MARRPTLPHPFRSWLYTRPLDELVARLYVTKTTIRGWRTARTHPAPSRFAHIKMVARRDGVTLTTDDLLPRAAK